MHRPKTGTTSSSASTCTRTRSYFASYGDSFIFRGPIRSADGADNIGTALLLELPDRAAAEQVLERGAVCEETAGMRGRADYAVVFGD